MHAEIFQLCRQRTPVIGTVAPNSQARGSGTSATMKQAQRRHGSFETETLHPAQSSVNTDAQGHGASPFGFPQLAPGGPLFTGLIGNRATIHGAEPRPEPVWA